MLLFLGGLSAAGVDLELLHSLRALRASPTSRPSWMFDEPTRPPRSALPGIYPAAGHIGWQN